MNRREFLKSAFAFTALGSVSRLAAQVAPKTAEEVAEAIKTGKVTRRPYKNTDITLPLLGYGLMRMPKLDPAKQEIDLATGQNLIDRAMEAGVNYFDTAYVYHGGDSEKFAGKALKKYPRESYFLVTKMPVRNVASEADVDRIFKEQLERCQTEYFDFYLLHNLNKDQWPKVEQYKIYDYLKEQQKAGKIRRLGFSFHDEPEILETIAAAHEWDFAQIQLNYFDWDAYRSREQYEVLTKRGIPVVVMEPLRGGTLASLNPEATEIFRKADPNASTASWAFRYVASLPNVMTVLSGMTYAEHLEDNIKTFTDFKPLTDEERKVIADALAAYKKSGAVPCTGCRYCMPCPMGVDIPRIFALYNQYKSSGNAWSFVGTYSNMAETSRASACVKCGACLSKCPQKINIPEKLEMIQKEYESLKK